MRMLHSASRLPLAHLIHDTCVDADEDQIEAAEDEAVAEDAGDIEPVAHGWSFIPAKLF